jgi:hypothetical protein
MKTAPVLHRTVRQTGPFIVMMMMMMMMRMMIQYIKIGEASFSIVPNQYVGVSYATFEINMITESKSPEVQGL